MTGRWKPGESGNPSGRPKGLRHRRTLIEEQLLTRDDVEGLVRSLLAAANQGDVQAAGILLDRVVPRLRPVAQPVTVAIPPDASLTEAGLAVLKAAAAGDLGTDAARDLVGALGSLARLTEVDELRERIARLEGLTHEQR